MSEATSDLTTLGNEARTLLKTLLEDADRDGRVQLSTAALAQRTGLTQGALVRARTELTRSLLLRVEKGYTASGRPGANVYVLKMDRAEPVSSTQTEGESGQNRTEEAMALPTPAVSLVLASSGESERPRSGIWSRMFRRKQAF